MKHFLTKLIQQEADESTHRRFIKFSKGDFPNGGPILSVKSTKKNNLAINGSFEYEDLIGYFVAKHMPEASYKVGGAIYTQPRVTLESIQDKLENVSLQDGWAQGQRDLKNLFMYPADLIVSPKKLTKIYDNLADDCYLLITITPEKGKEWAFKSDNKIPPLKKTFGKIDPYVSCKPEKLVKCASQELCKKTGICIDERAKFCKTKTPALTSDELKDFLQLILPDFPELHNPFTDLLIVNRYTINNLIFPEDKDTLDPKDLREKIKKAGFIERVVNIDEKSFSKKVDFAT